MDWSSLADSTIPSLSDTLGGMTGVATHSATNYQYPSRSTLLSQMQATASDTVRQTVTPSLEERLEQQDTNILLHIINQTKAESKRRTDQAIEDQLQRMWEQDCASYRNQLRTTRKQPGALTAATSNNRMLPTLTGAAYAPDQTDVDPQFLSAHWKIIQNSKNQQPLDIIQQLVSVADSKAYRTGWNLMAHLARIHPSTPTPAAQAQAALAHFSKEYAQLIVQRVINQPGGFVAQCQAFAKFNLGVVDDFFWPTLYFLLRGGDTVSALQLVQSHRGTADPAIAQMLNDLAKLQGNYSCIFDNPSGILFVNESLQGRVDELLTSARSRQPQNIYELGVYCFLSGSKTPEVSDTMEGFKNIEDWLTSLLWGAVLSKDQDTTLMEFGETIQYHGASHFSDEALGGWSYCLPLLASQQYKTALIHLAQTGGQTGLLQATHLSMMLTKAGIPVKNLVQKETSSGDSETTTRLLSEYAHLVKTSIGAAAALDYLVHIPDEFRARKEIATLIANSQDRETLAGKLNNEGRREGGALAQHFADVAPILIEAANKSFDKNSKEKASNSIVCLMLAEQYPAVLNMLNSLICPPSETDGLRSFWMDQISGFHASYMAGPSYVRNKLQEADAMNIVESSKVLVGLNRFHESVRRQDSAMRSLLIVQELNILPTSETDSRLKEKTYADVSPLVKAAFPKLLTTVVENILYQEFNRLKQEFYADKSQVVRDRLSEIQQTAKLYVSFATTVQLNGEEYRRLSQLTALMA